jgi:ribosome biogenesis GTPase
LPVSELGLFLDAYNKSAGFLEGVVIKSTGSWYKVYTKNGEVIPCKLRGAFRVKGIKTTNPVTVGDQVGYEMVSGDKTGVIFDIKPRENYIIRKATKLSKVSHIIAANIDEAFLVVTLAKPRTSTGFIDRFLITSEAYHIPANIIFNKLDIYDSKMREKLASLTEIYQDAGYPCLNVSALRGDNIEQLKTRIRDRISLFAGHSGVGKSALINMLQPGLDLKTKPISEVHQKGIHTTTFAEMIPLDIGGFIIDTPGIKEFGLYDLERETLAERYPEMRALMHECKYYNCTHIHEPGCAVKEAVKQGRIHELRYNNYVAISHSDELN